MGRLFLVRHAQASFLSDNYDQLSTMGETQARLLGECWTRRKMVFDRVSTGPAVRHRRTAEIVAQVYQHRSLDFPQPIAVPEFDEFQADAVMSEGLSQLLPHSTEIRQMHETLQRASNEGQKGAAFQRLFETVISMWVRGEVTIQSAGSWQEFCARVNQGLSRFFAAAKKGEVAAIFTSGGPISVCAQRALQLSSQETLRVAWMSRNCSFSEFLFSGDRVTLSTFNSFPHLDDEALLTYR
ncbi:MAG TPA: histidine phosphatase family protein [Candidatus Methylomirabilis sp.]|nr:histidine phosphatase family protein [Candidatus Methylomirabilis sp.]